MAITDFEYHGYYADKNGNIYDCFGDPVPVQKNGTVRLTFDGTKHNISAARVVYEAVSGEKGERKYVLEFKDGNKNNISYSNIRAIPRKEYFKGREWSTQKLSRADKERMCVIYYSDDNAFTQPELAKKFGVSLNLTEKILNQYRLDHHISKRQSHSFMRSSLLKSDGIDDSQQ